MVTVVRPLRPHPARPPRVLERRVERQHRHALLGADRAHKRVQPPDGRLRSRPAAVPRQDVGERYGQPDLEAAPHHPPQRVRRVLDRPALRDVVDPALDDERVGAGDAPVEPPLDLLGPLAVDAAVPEVETRVRPRRPPLPLASLVERRPDPPPPHLRIGVPERRAGRDRVAERRDTPPFHRVYHGRTG
jgi:hypothetical protein